MMSNKKQNIEDAKDAEIRMLKQQLESKHQELVQTNQALAQKQATLNAAMQIIYDTIEGCYKLYKWGSLPVEIRNDPTCVIPAIIIEDKIGFMRESDIPKDMLQNNRQVALEACKAGLYKEFCPTQEEWRDSEALTVHALAKA